MSDPPAWDDGWARVWAEAHGAGPAASLVPARVVRIDKGGITVADGAGADQLVVAAKSARRVVVGDVVALDPAAGRIEAILPRRTVFERRSPGADRDDVRLSARPVAANMDRVLVLQPLDAGVNLARLARELVLAWESGAVPVVVLTKADLVDPATVEHERAEAARFAPGVEVVVASTRTAGGLGALGDQAGHGRVVALLGASGAGKSSLANALAGHRVALVAEVREGDRRGRHTTTAGQMIGLADGGWLIDTPGIRGVGLWAADEGLERAFADLLPYAERCRFADCTHRSEPGCGIVAAVADGEVAADRLEVWHRLIDELEDLEAGLVGRDRELEREDNRRSRRRARGRDERRDPDDGQEPS
ncbi:MAG: ribosome small subunit-dependent GTPase A [Microthrixaceae bacterium]